MNIISQLKRDEGFRSSAYQDHLGYLTIGIGRLIDSRKGGGITEGEAEMLLLNDIQRRQKELSAALPWFGEVDEVRQGVLLNMAFQLGASGLLAFKKALGFVQKKQYMAAANEMLASKWAEQTPERAQRLSKQMMTGVWQ